MPNQINIRKLKKKAQKASKTPYSQREKEFFEAAEEIALAWAETGVADKYDPQFFGYLCGHGAGCKTQSCSGDIIYLVTVALPAKEMELLRERILANPKLSSHIVGEQKIQHNNLVARCNAFGVDFVLEQMKQGVNFTEFLFAYSFSVDWIHDLVAVARVS